jgi:outer membrane lipoprotein-sorting protein
MTRHRLLVVCVLAAVVLAGCGAGTTGEDADVTAEEVRSQLESGLEGVEGYRTTTTLDLSLSGNNIQQNISVRTDAKVDTANRRAQSTVTTSVAGQNVTSEVYFVDGVLYQRSQIFVQQYSSEWVRQSFPANVSDPFASQDVTASLDRTLDNATLSVTGTEQVDGVDTYVLEAELNGSAIAEFALGSSGTFDNIEVSDASQTIYVDQETGRPVRIDGAFDMSLSLQGQTIDASATVGSEFTYESVTVTLPEAANTAVNISAAGN